MAIQISGTTVIDNSRNVNAGITTTVQISAGSSTGILGQVLISTGTGIGWTTASAGITELDNIIGRNSTGIRSDSANGRLNVFGQGNFQVFTSPGTYVVNPGISSIRVRVVGAGGNGGTGGSAPGFVLPNPGTSAGAGGGGGYTHKVITSFTAPRSYTVTVGSAPGGTSSFGPECSATGGSNGTNGNPSSPSPPTDVSGGVGGIGTGGNVNFTGATGSSSNGQKAGIGGASATQKGDGSGNSVPGLPSLNRIGVYVQSPSGGYFIPAFLVNRPVERFPFDIFWGVPGLTGAPGIGNISGATPSMVFAGYSGGNGTPGVGPSDPLSGGGPGGTGAGGGGAIFNSAQPGQVFTGGEGGLGGGGGGGGLRNPYAPAGDGGAGGAGGSGIVIVEW